MQVKGIQCKHCGTRIYSKHRHDYVNCKCGKVAIDGGRDYTKTTYPGGDYSDHFMFIDIDLPATYSSYTSDTAPTDYGTDTGSADSSCDTSSHNSGSSGCDGGDNW